MIQAAFKQSLEDDADKWQECLEWLLSCQNTTKHPFTGAAPGGWGWSDLSGAVPGRGRYAGSDARVAKDRWMLIRVGWTTNGMQAPDFCGGFDQGIYLAAWVAKS